MPQNVVRIGCTDLKLRQLGRLVSRHYDERLKSLGLKNSQYGLLTYLDSLGPLQLNVLARRMRLDASTLSRNLQLMIEAGWVSVKQGANGRIRIATITSSGLRLLRRAEPIWADAQRSLTAILGDATAIALRASLDASLRALENASPASAL